MQARSTHVQHAPPKLLKLKATLEGGPTHFRFQALKASADSTRVELAPFDPALKVGPISESRRAYSVTAPNPWPTVSAYPCSLSDRAQGHAPSP